MKEKIYLIPGLMCDERLWSKLLPQLEEEFELVHLPIPLSDDFDERIKIINDSIKEQDDVNLLGFSLGGYIAAYFAINFPKRVKRLMILSATPCPMSEVELRKREQGIAFIKKHGFKGLSKKKVQSLVETTNQTNMELIELIQAMYVDLGEKVFFSQISSSLHRKDLFDELYDLSLPITFCYATNDRLLIHNALQSFEARAEHITFHKIDSSAHFLPLERADEMALEIKEWMK